MYFICIDKLTNEPSCLIRESDKVGIPFDEGNLDYQAYLTWVAEGNTAEEWNTEETE